MAKVRKLANMRKQMLAVLETVRWLNRSPLGCRVERVKSDPVFDYADRIEKRFNRRYPNIRGTSKDGKTIWIERLVRKKTYPVKKKCEFMREEAARGAIVGVAYDYGDAWDIVSGIKRKIRTYSYQGEKNGKTQEDDRDDGSDDGNPPHGDPKN